MPKVAFMHNLAQQMPLRVALLQSKSAARASQSLALSLQIFCSDLRVNPWSDEPPSLNPKLILDADHDGDAHFLLDIFLV